MMFKFESLFAFWALELPENGALVVADHVALQTIHIGERFVTNFTGLKQSFYIF